MAVIAEPTQLNIVHAHKGGCRWHIVDDRPVVPQLGARSRASTRFIAWAGSCRPSRRYAARVAGQRACDPLLGPPTLSVGRIEGGTSVNTVPDRCRIEIDRRLIRGEDPLKQCGSP